MPSSTQWRLLIAGSNAPPYCTIGEIEFRATAGGADQCDTIGGTASASGAYGGTYVAANAFDNTTSTAWSKGPEALTSAWIQFTFGSAVDVEEITLQAANFWSNEMPSAADLQYWDGGAWATYFGFTGQTGWVAGELRTFGAPAPTVTGSAAATLASLTSSATGTAYQTIAGSAANDLGALLSAGLGTASAPVPRVRRIALLGSERRTVALHATLSRCRSAA